MPKRHDELTLATVEAFKGVEATSDIAPKTGDNPLPKHRQPKEIGRKRKSLQYRQFTFASSLFPLRQ